MLLLLAACVSIPPDDPARCVVEGQWHADLGTYEGTVEVRDGQVVVIGKARRSSSITRANDTLSAEGASCRIAHQIDGTCTEVTCTGDWLPRRWWR